jgi:ribosomal protein S18 acetylase RimI-like enzyme
MVKMPAALAQQGFVLRPEAESDIFLRQLYISTCWEELAIVLDWTDERKVQFLECQFAFQRHHYRTYCPDTAWCILEYDGAGAGRIYVDRQPTRIEVLVISLLPEWRGRGIGTALMQAVCAEARNLGKAVRIAVEKFNPAQRLYRRLGFHEISEEDVYWFMEWRAHNGGYRTAEL